MGPVAAFFFTHGKPDLAFYSSLLQEKQISLSVGFSLSRVSLPPKLEQHAARQSVNLFGTVSLTVKVTGASLPFRFNFAAPHLGFQILQVLVQDLKAEEEKRRVQSLHRWKLQLGKFQCFETSVFKSL